MGPESLSQSEEIVRNAANAADLSPKLANSLPLAQRNPSQNSAPYRNGGQYRDRLGEKRRVELRGERRRHALSSSNRNLTPFFDRVLSSQAFVGQTLSVDAARRGRVVNLGATFSGRLCRSTLDRKSRRL
eukprot:scaffold1878_cov258-Pinguiococcus_pyrenoidosus.AAC.4